MGLGCRRSDTSRKKKQSITVKPADVPRLKVIREGAKCKDNAEAFRWMLLLAEKYFGIQCIEDGSSILDESKLAGIPREVKIELPDANTERGEVDRERMENEEETTGDIVSDAARAIREDIEREQKERDGANEELGDSVAVDGVALRLSSESEKEEATANQQSGRSRRSKRVRVRQSKEGGIKCSKCPFRYPTEEAVAIHEAGHDARIQVCDKCDKEFANLEALKAHIRFVHDKRYECGDCDKKFGTKYLLAQHQRAHTGEKPFPCETCGKAFSTSSSLKAHVESHNSERSYLCHECGAAYRRRDCLKQHILRCHKTDEEFQCELCGKSFKYRESLKNHLEHHKNVQEGRCPYQCHLCSKSFTVAATLQRHMSTHKTIFKCGSCDREFSHRHHLKRHSIVHTGERPFECPQCDRKFGLRTTLLTHMRLHTGEKPYRCRMCPVAFRRNYSLRNHMKKAHAIDVPKRGPGSLPLHDSNQDNVPQEVLMELQLQTTEEPDTEIHTEIHTKNEVMEEGAPMQFSMQIEYADDSIPQNVAYNTTAGEVIEASELIENADSQQAVMTLANMSHHLNVQQMEELQQQVQQQLQQAEGGQHVQEVRIQQMEDGTQTVEYVAFPVNFTIPTTVTTSESEPQEEQLIQ